MNRLLIFIIFGFVLSLVGVEAVTTNCELKEKINRALRELPIVEERKQHKPLGNPLHGARSPPNKRPGRDSIPQLAKNIESFLQKVIPNHNLVQDLMGYITMPNPNASKNRQH